MNEVHYHNDGKETVYIGGRSVPPGETKLVDAALVPRKVAEASAQDQSDDAADAQPGDEPQVNQEEAAGQEDSAERDALLQMLLDDKVEGIKAALPIRNDEGSHVWSVDDLARLIVLEEQGANRKTLIEAVQAEMFSRAADAAEGEG